MIKKTALALIVLSMTVSCVSKKVFTDLETKFADLKKENRHLIDQNDSITKTKNQLDVDFAALKSNYEKSTKLRRILI